MENSIRAFAIHLSSFLEYLRSQDSVDDRRAIIWIHVLVRQPNTTKHGLLEVFDCSTWARCNAIQQGIL